MSFSILEPSILTVVVVQPDEIHANRTIYDRFRAYKILIKRRRTEKRRQNVISFYQPGTCHQNGYEWDSTHARITRDVPWNRGSGNP